MDVEKYTPAYSHELELVRRGFSERLQVLNDGKPFKLMLQQSGEPAKILGEPGSEYRAIRITLTSNDYAKYSGWLGTDWDDTCENYTERKQRLYKALSGGLDEQTKDNFRKSSEQFNKAARILPFGGTHPERYAPLLELMAISDLLKQFQSGEFSSQATELFNNPNEHFARKYIDERILVKLADNAEMPIIALNGIKEGKPKIYFQEQEYFIVSLDYSKKPAFVDEGVWERYKLFMASANIPEDQFGNFDINDDIYWMVTTFGEPGYQLEKIIEGLKVLKRAGKRIPDAILCFEMGRKRKFLEEFSKRFSDRAVYLDDSLGQLEEVRGLGMQLVHAIRPGAKRSESVTPVGILSVNPAEQSLQEIYNKAVLR